MRDLSTIRDGWPMMEAEETRLLREMSLPEGLRTYAMLYEAFAARFRDEQDRYAQEREVAVMERQRKLARLARWITESS